MQAFETDLPSMYHIMEQPKLYATFNVKDPSASVLGWTLSPWGDFQAYLKNKMKKRSPSKISSAFCMSSSKHVEK